MTLLMQAGFAALAMTMIAGVTAAQAQELRGHGGPVRAVAVSPDGQMAVTGSFDQSVILWRLQAGSADAVLRFHDGSVNAVTSLPDGRFASGGEDGRIALWRSGKPEPDQVITGHSGPVSALAVSSDGKALASASWDGTARVTPLDGTATRVLEGHRGQLNGVAFLPGGGVVTSGYDATLRLWPADGSTPRIITLPSVLNAVVAAPSGEIVVAGGDGMLRFVADGKVTAEIQIAETPLVALAITRDGLVLAAGGIRGNVAIIDRATRAVRANLVGPGLPVWSLAFTPDGKELLSGGADRLVRRWNALTGEHIGAVVPRASADPLAAFSGADGNERGAQVFRACAACHTLTKEDGNRAGPTLHGIMGRRIGTAHGYNFSVALKGMDIVWTPDTVARLFEIGPNAMTPGTKMPEQVITSAEDRKALVDWLARVTR
ncbi:MAG: c-type cytochrome [Bosea sp. (in: a-proteobacteria)]